MLPKITKLFSILGSLLTKKAKEKVQNTKTTPPPLEFPYLLLRVWTEAEMEGPSREQRKKRNEALSMIVAEKVRQLANDQPVIILYSPLKRPANSAKLLRTYLEEMGIEVSSIIMMNVLARIYDNNCTDKVISDYCRKIVNGHYTVCITHDVNIVHYCESAHNIRITTTEIKPGEGITSKGERIEIDYTE